MRYLFYIGIAGWILFEIANVYFIMPMPGSQDMESLAWAYLLHQNRWAFRSVFGVLAFAGLMPAFQASRWRPLGTLALAIALGSLFNIEMAADRMFLQPNLLYLADANTNMVKPEKLVLGIAMNGQAKAYPIQFLGYHHQVFDTIGATPVMVTYCTVCRTGRVFSPVVNGAFEKFRLVGMDHFNAMFEDASTKSWWRQATGEAVAGPLKGTVLPEIPSFQTSLQAWLALYPNSQVMQRDPSFAAEYDSMDTYDLGIGRGKLTRTDTASWKEKSWVIGIALDKQHAKAYDWNRLKKERMVIDQIGNLPLLLVLASDNASFAAFKRPDVQAAYWLKGDTLCQEGKQWDLRGRSLVPGLADLERVQAYQEFWHSWRSFHPHTTRY